MSNVSYIGFSLSVCIRHIALGLVPEESVAMIIAGTCYRNHEEMQRVLETYKEYDWIVCTEEAVAIFHRLKAANKIFQPRLLDHRYRRPACTEVWAILADDNIIKSIRLMAAMEGGEAL